MAEQHDPSSRTYRRIDTANGLATVSMEFDGGSVVLSRRWGTNISQSRWPRCAHAECFGSTEFSDQNCFRHSANRSDALHRSLAGNVDARIDFRGMEVTEELWAEAERYFAERRSLMCSGALFGFPVKLSGRTLREIDLAGASFELGLELLDCEIAELDISYADLGKSPSRMEVCKMSRVNARGIHANRSLSVTECAIGDALFDGATSADLLFDGSTMKSLSLRDATVDSVSLSNVEILTDLNVGGLSSEEFRANGVVARTGHIGSVSVAGRCDFTSAHFKSRVQLQVKSEVLVLSGAIFEAGGRLDVGRATVRLDGLVSRDRLTVVGRDGASIASVHNADAGALTLLAIDLADCTFWGSPNLDEIIIESLASMREPPGWWRTRRRCVADEFIWRHFHANSWYHSKRLPDGTESTGSVTASQTAAVYRALRKSFEARSDQPGAADFYYGEMEMRRRDKRVSGWDRFLLTVYWLVSGYGLRAMRSLTLLIALLAGGSLLMAACGIADPGAHTIGNGVIVALENSIPGSRSETALTNTGRSISLVLKVSVPVLAALAVLAIRNRVKR